MYSRLFIAMAAVLVVAVSACHKTDHDAPTAGWVGPRPGDLTGIPGDLAATADAESQSPTAMPSSVVASTATNTASPFDGVETHPLTRIPSGIPSRPGVQPTSTPGGDFQFERRSDSFPVDGPRPYVEINWNVPIPVAGEDQKTFLGLLRLIPDTPENRQELLLGDHAAWRAQVGFDLPSYEDGKDAYIDEFLRVVSARIPAPWPGEGPYLSGATDYRSQLQTFEPLGFDHRNADQTVIAATAGPGRTEIIVGRYDPARSRRLLAECECPQPDPVTIYGGHEYWSWGDGNLRQRMALPLFDSLGRGGHVLMTTNGLYRTFTVPLMELLIDTLNGGTPSLADSPDHAFIMDVMGAYNANRIRVQPGARFAREVALPDGDGMIIGSNRSDGSSYTISRESNRANADLAPLLLSFESLGSGTGWDGEQTFDVVVIVNADEAAAIANAHRLADRLVNSNSHDGLPWALKAPRLDISVSGKYLVALFRAEERSGSVSSGFNGNFLFAHE